MKKKQEVTPLQIVEQVLEKEYIADKELQGRYDNKIKIQQTCEETINNLSGPLEEYKHTLQQLADIIIQSALSGNIVPDTNVLYQEKLKLYIETEKKMKIAYESRAEAIKQAHETRNISNHKYMVFWRIVKALGAPEKNYQQWIEKYKDSII